MNSLTTTDKLLIALALKSAGIKARVRKFPSSIRVVFDGSWEAVAAALNAEGYRHANGRAFDRFSFEGQQVFVRGVA